MGAITKNDRNGYHGSIVKAGRLEIKTNHPKPQHAVGHLLEITKLAAMALSCNQNTPKFGSISDVSHYQK